MPGFHQHLLLLEKDRAQMRLQQRAIAVRKQGEKLIGFLHQALPVDRRERRELSAIGAQGHSR